MRFIIADINIRLETINIIQRMLSATKYFIVHCIFSHKDNRGGRAKHAQSIATQDNNNGSFIKKIETDPYRLFQNSFLIFSKSIFFSRSVGFSLQLIHFETDLMVCFETLFTNVNKGVQKCGKQCARAAFLKKTAK